MILVYLIILFIIFAGAMIYAGYNDYKTGKIPDITHLILIVGFIMQMPLQPKYSLESAMVALLLSGMFLVMTFFRYDAIGGGDIKLVFTATACIGQEAVISLFFSLLLVLIYLLVIKEKKQSVRFAPFMAITYIPMYAMKLVSFLL